MADRMLFISWGGVARGREARSMEVFNDTLGLYGRMQQEGRIESFDVVLLNPNPGIDGYMELHGSAAQLAAVREDAEFHQVLADASMIVDDLSMVDGYTNAGIASQMEIYQEAISKVPQNA
jgi:hypothetical protein